MAWDDSLRVKVELSSAIEGHQTVVQMTAKHMEPLW